MKGIAIFGNILALRDVIFLVGMVLLGSVGTDGLKVFANLKAQCMEFLLGASVLWLKAEVAALRAG